MKGRDYETGCDRAEVICWAGSAGGVCPGKRSFDSSAGVSCVPGSLSAHLSPSSSLCPRLLPHMPPSRALGNRNRDRFLSPSVDSLATRPVLALCSQTSFPTKQSPLCHTLEGQKQGQGAIPELFLSAEYIATHLTNKYT